MRNPWRTLRVAASWAVLALSILAAASFGPAEASDTNFIDPSLLDDNPQVKQLMDQMKKEGIKPDSFLDAHFLFASLLWGSVGSGYLLYARKQRMVVPFLGGLAMIGASFFVASWVWMSVLCLGLMAGVYQLVKWGG